MHPVLLAIATIAVGVGGCVGYFYLANYVLDAVIFPARGRNAVTNMRRAETARPWVFLFPGLLLLVLYTWYPVAGSFVRSLYDRSGDEFVGAANYLAMWREGGRRAFLNNMAWVVIVPAMSTFIGLIAAQLTDKISWGSFAKSMIFMPMAVSFVSASLIWKFVYANDPEIGIINAVRYAFGADGTIDPLQIPIWNSFFLMVILIWIQTGFAMVILSAALRSVPEETVEAAILDGANPFQIFFRIQVPQIRSTILVVWTTITVLVLKVFDIVYTMTGGNFDTEILPSLMMDFMFRDDGRATAVAFVIMVAVLPVMWWNIRDARSDQR